MIQNPKPYRVSPAWPLSCGILACSLLLPLQAQDAAPPPPPPAAPLPLPPAPLPPAVVDPAPILPAPPAAPDAAPAEPGDARPAPLPIMKPKMPSGPSAKMAAELKREPPPAPSWVAHYLPDDRYKVAGGIWKYVSTELDTYYHLPNSPLMMSQPSNIVIGFSDQKMAEEAGYRPDNTVAAKIKAAELSKATAALPDGMKPLTATTTVTLGDGQSKVTVPAGWTHIKMPDMGGFMKNFSVDIFLPKGGGQMNPAMLKNGQKRPKMVMVMTMTNPRGINLEGAMQADFLKAKLAENRGADRAMDEMASQNPQLSQFASMWKDVEMTPSNWGGAKAVKLSAKKGSKNTAMISSGIIAARGPKVYIFQDTTGGGKDSSVIRNSFVAR